MHTLKPSMLSANSPLFDVWFVGSESLKATRIEIGIAKAEALKLVNYLNGGAGQEFGKPLQVDSY
jgi:hypothetical protein